MIPQITLSPVERQALESSGLCLLGYGSQGRAEALNLKRSQISFVIGCRPGPSWDQAIADGFTPLAAEEAMAQAKTLVMNLSDQAQSEFYRSHIKGKGYERMIFAHGFNTHFKRIPLETEAHLLVAPKGAASGLVSYYGTPDALPAILAVENARQPDEEWTLAAAYAKAIGCHPQSLIKAQFKDETDCDLFAEQVLLCGGVSQLLEATFETMVEAGYNEETAYFESLFELKLIVDLIWREGIAGMRAKISPTARYGDLTRGPRVIDDSVKRRMRDVLKEIQDGRFATEFLSEVDSTEFKKKESSQKNHPLQIIGDRLRKARQHH
jgi:ketol-acid reductoisomerase